MKPENITQLIVAIGALITAVNTLVSTLTNRKVKKLTKAVNGQTTELIEKHRAEAYSIGYGDAHQGLERRSD